MADTRTLKLSLLADVAKFTAGMNEAEGSTKDLNSKIGGYSKKMAKAFLGVAVAVGTMAVAIGVDAVKAAADDEASQKKFQETLKNTAGVVDETVVKSINDWIQKMQFASGYSDTQLRDSLGRLTRSTGNVSTAQDILSVAMDTSRGTGKDLTTITDNLAKAYDGNYTPLKKMGVKLDENKLSTEGFEYVLGTLTTLFGGQASTYADTFQGKLDIVNQRFGELKESAGAPLLGVLGGLLDQVNYVAMAMGGEDPESLSQRARELAGVYDGKGAGGYNLGLSILNLTDGFKELFDALNGDKATGASSTLQTFADALNAVAGGITAIAGAYSSAKSIGGKILDTLIMGEGKGGYLSGLPGLPFGAPGTGVNGQRALGGPVSNTNSYLVGERGPEIFTPSVGGKITPNGAGGGVTIVMNGVIDGESARRSIERLLQDSARRTGAINLIGATL